MKKIIAYFVLISLLTSCTSLTSVTTIKPNNQFILGNNNHGSFKVKLKNISKNALEIYMAPVDGGRYSPQTVAPNQVVNLKVSPNTALVIANNSNVTLNVSLNVKGDIGFMQYKN